LYKRIFFEKKVQRLPYFEKIKSEVAMFTQWVHGGCHNKMDPKKHNYFCVVNLKRNLAHSSCWQNLGRRGGNPGHNVAKEIKMLNWKESLKNNSSHGFFSLFWKNGSHMGYLFDICICDDMCNSNLFVRIWFFFL
jgi:hypothetical protein